MEPNYKPSIVAVTWDGVSPALSHIFQDVPPQFEILLFDNTLTRAVAQLPIPKTPLDILGAIFLPRVSSIFIFGEFYILQPSAPRYSA